VKPVEIERVRHLSGELLRSGDLRAEVRSDVERMWWHQRAMHDAVGVATGLEATAGAAGVVVSPGLGYDPAGREVRLAEEAAIAPPDDDGHIHVLILRHCAGREARLAWVRLSRMRRCDGVPIAELVPGEGGGLKPWPGRVRPIARPRFAFGATVPGSTAWEPWLALERRTGGSGIEVRVDTSATGFTGRPCYFAWLAWPGIAARDPRIATLSLGLQHVGDETPSGFTFRVALRLRAFAAGIASVVLDDGALTWARSEQLYVHWIGVDDELDAGSDA
jgi:hypothetical protein